MVAGHIIVVAVLAINDFKGNIGLISLISVDPITAAVAKVKAIAPGRFVDVTVIGVAIPILATVE